MSAGPRCQPLNWRLTPQEAVARWPCSEPLACLWSAEPAGPAAARLSRWTILARPGSPAPPESASAGRGAARLRDGELSRRAPAERPPFQGGYIVMLPYELGTSFEPAAAGRVDRPRDDRHWGGPVWLPCPAAAVYDHAAGQWWAVGEPPARSRLPALPDLAPSRGGWALGEPAGLAERDRARYEAAAGRIVEYIRAGDILQANLTHRLSASFGGDARALFLELTAVASPWYGAYLELPRAGGGGRRAVLSASPELFLEVDGASGRIVTRPIKGTLAGHLPAAALDLSEKDRAELTMIVDLMRNDIGRVCRVGSVRVAEARAIERHGGGPGEGSTGVWHGVATVEGVLRDEATLNDLLRATFPGGSITGAPKIRAMQIIEELESVQRGPYTGAIGYVSDSGHACFNIAIRTAAVSEPRGGAGEQREQHGVFTGATCDYGVGAGIVADSEPRSEWEETLHKAAPFLALSNRGAARGGTALGPVSCASDRNQHSSETRAATFTETGA